MVIKKTKRKHMLGKVQQPKTRMMQTEVVLQSTTTYHHKLDTVLDGNGERDAEMQNHNAFSNVMNQHHCVIQNSTAGISLCRVLLATMSRAPLGLKNISKMPTAKGERDFRRWLSIVWQNYRKEKIILRFGCSFKDWWFT